MAVRIVSNAPKGTDRSIGEYWDALVSALGLSGMGVDRIRLDDWRAGKVKASPKSDLLIVDNQDCMHIAPEHAVLAVQHGTGMERGLRLGAQTDIDMGRQEWAAARRKRTFWVACSDWAAAHCRHHTGVSADRIICGAVDVDAFFPSERQVTRDAKRPVVLHDCMDPESGNQIIGAVATALGDEFEVRPVSAASTPMAEALHAGDIWLSLSASQGLPTVVMEAQASDLVVVGTNVGVLWPYCQGQALQSRDKGAVAWLNKEAGAVVFDWQWRRRPEYIADWVRAAWAQRAKLHPRDFALKWYSLELFGQKWVAAIDLAARRFGLSGSAPGPEAKAKPSAQPKVQHRRVTAHTQKRGDPASGTRNKVLAHLNL